MKMWLWMAALCGILNAAGQSKKWDGEGGDAAWTNGKNWYPDGIPLTTDNIQLDHSFVTGAYAVYLPDGNISIEVNSIEILGSKTDSIKLVIPETNTISPAIILNSTVVSLIINDGGILVNQSGASTGNTFQCAGNIRIADGGTYLHQTIRGTAAIVSKLFVDSNDIHGNFELDVPGTAGYILSLSARTYPTLTLSANRSGGKRSYSGSGNSTLNILGNLHINKGASLITTLNGSIQIHGSFINEGNIQLNPTATDTVGRSLVFMGQPSSFSNQGTFNCNASFRKISIDKNASLQLNTDFVVLQNQLLFEVNGHLICNEYVISGMGTFKSNQGAWIHSSAPVVLSTHLNEGSIRISQPEINNKTGFAFTGTHEQHTGNAFPDSISALSVNKFSNMVILDKPVHVNDSLTLQKGILKSNLEHFLSFAGTVIHASNPYQPQDTNYTGYISGKLQYHTTTNDSLFFPLGNDTMYAPCIITGASNNSYLVDYDMEDHLPTIPLKFNRKTFSHWHLQKSSDIITNSNQEQIALYLNNISLNQREQPVIVYNNNMDSNWNNIQHMPTTNSTSFIKSHVSNLLDGVYSMASQFTEALPMEQIYLRKNEFNGFKGLTWQAELDAAPSQFMVEKSFNGITFQSLDIKPDQINRKRNEFQITLPNQEAVGFFRIVALVGDRKVFSNIIHIDNSISLKAFPNPAHERFYIQLEQRYQNDRFELLDMLGKKHELTLIWNGTTACMDVKHLLPGIYILIFHQEAMNKTWRFLKT